MFAEVFSKFPELPFTTTTLVVIFLVLVTTYFWLLPSHDPRCPPCPVRILPVVGNLLSMDPNTRKLFWKWKTQVGDIFSLYLGNSMMVVLNSYPLIKECLVKNGNTTSDRPPFIYINENGNLGGKKLIFTARSDQVWRVHRALSLSTLRAFEMDRNIMASKIEEEVTFFLEALSELNGKPSDISMLTNTSISNIICSILIGQRFDYNDQRFQLLVKTMLRDAEVIAGTNILSIFPIFAYLPGDRFHAKEIQRNFRFQMDFIQEYIDKTKIGLDGKSYNLFLKDCEGFNYSVDRSFEEKDDNGFKRPSAKPRSILGEETKNFTHSYLSVYLAEMKRLLEGGNSTTLNNDNLVVCAFELFAAGKSTSANTIMWSILFILHNPYVQDKIHAEMDTFFGHSLDRDLLPCADDRKSLIYLQAAIMETLRLCSLVPLSVMHYCNKDTVVGGYLIPKGAMIASNLDAVLLDPKVWGQDVHCFRPERFIDENGDLIHREELIPFGIGKRSCLGEPLAKMELFLFLASLFKRFKVLPVDEANLPSLEPKFGLATRPYPYEVILVKRQSEN